MISVPIQWQNPLVDKNGVATPYLQRIITELLREIATDTELRDAMLAPVHAPDSGGDSRSTDGAVLLGIQRPAAAPVGVSGTFLTTDPFTVVVENGSIKSIT